MPPMDTSLRHEAGHATPEYKTIFDFTDVAGVLRAAEKCNGSGDCRKDPTAGGTMCPSCMATGQSIRNYLKQDWIKDLRPLPGSYQFPGWEEMPVSKRLDWKNVPNGSRRTTHGLLPANMW